MRKLMWLTVGFAGACAIGAYFYNPWLLLMAVGCLALAAVFWALTRWKRGLRIACAVFLGAALGFGWFYTYDLTALQFPRQIDGKTETAVIEVSDYTYETDTGSAFDGKLQHNGRSYKVRVYLNDAQDLQPGDSICGKFRFRMTFWNGKDTLNNAGKGIYLFATQKSENVELVNSQHRWSHYPAIWRHELKAIIDNAFPDDVDGFARALLLGDTSGVDYETDTALKISGIRHVIAVSGLHVSVVFGFIYLLSAKRRSLTALLGIPAVVLFAALAGFTPSVTRACIMQILMMLALLVNKEYDPATTLSFAVVVMLAANPMAIGSVSFQLSVVSMIGIFLFSRRIYGWMTTCGHFGNGKSKFSTLICGSISVTLGAMVTTTPLSAYYFGTVSIIGIFTNLLTLWAITIVFYGIVLTCVLGCIWLPMAQVTAGVIAGLIRYVVATATVLSAVPMGAVYTKSVYVVLWLIFVYVLLAVHLLIKRKSAGLLAGVIVLSLCVSVGLSWVEPLLGECRVTMLDVGQGQAILLQSDGKNFLVDCGGDYEKGAADDTAETLLSQGVRKLDGIIVTHFDGDHAGGVPYLLTRVSAENLFLPYAADPSGVGEQLANVSSGAVHSVREDITLCYDDVEITIFAPVSYNSGNESSMCVLFRTKNCDILIVGDRGEQTERMLLDKHDLPELDVLVAGHHGSKTSTSIELLEATRPEYMFISVGKDNSYGHPAQQTLERAAEFGCKVLRTDQHGTVIFRR